MARLTRRRFLTITAGLAGLGLAPARAEIHEWRGIALGASARILIAHPEAEAITAAAAAEIARLETVFSLTRADSALMRLNASGRLDDPPFELLDCLALCDAVHAATAGAFDPTVQPLWALYAERFSAGRAPSRAEIAQVLPRIGWGRVEVDSSCVTLAPGQALTLNGVAQGVIADRVAGLLRARGLSDILIDTGEFHALGGRPGGGGWPVRLAAGGEVELTNRGLASSSALGTSFDAAGRVGHILDPRTGQPAPPRWRLVTITAPQAGLADALSTAACLMPETADILAALAGFEGARLEHLA
ncbi:FAD:protein FMN transferase [Rhodobacter maris]|uniref:FAD:protein FMN transferase n=1 Tax=Rhodobacter maris TaxID=446682 RepID=A0A285T6E2_9RHOB|nr:FAD:protein FMN transferase [Rhodobacter maris]SOC16993.1 thiamine biosynthesis lipoprotein [Rhodobacter maris]